MRGARGLAGCLPAGPRDTCDGAGGVQSAILPERERPFPLAARTLRGVLLVPPWAQPLGGQCPGGGPYIPCPSPHSCFSYKRSVPSEQTLLSRVLLPPEGQAG